MAIFTFVKNKPVHIALLRGINVGGRNKLPMKALTAIFTESECEDVRTYIQSGNILFEATNRQARALPKAISSVIEERFGFLVPVVLRSADELRLVAEGNPFLKANADPKALHVAFLADHPSAERVATLDPNRSPSDEFALQGREIYLHCPKGLARTKLTNAYFDRTLGTTTTIRNWRTLLELVKRSERQPQV